MTVGGHLTGLWVDYHCTHFDERLLSRSGEKFRNHQETVGQSAEMGAPNLAGIRTIGQRGGG